MAEKRKLDQPAAAAAQGKTKKKKVEYIYGNYAHYYGYRVGRTLEEDPRLSVLRREWIEGKDCLDVGCNEGYVTIALAERFRCKSMLGVDIDSSLVCKARRNLKLVVEEGDGDENGGLEGSAGAESGEATGDGSWSINEGGGETLTRAELSSRVTFKTQNYLDTEAKPGSYDTVLCLSISKWIHLNWGDDGLLKFFAKIFRELRPGGRLILEPQPWTSYAKKRRVSKAAQENYQRIIFRPEDFPMILTEKIGFKSYDEIVSELPSDKSGFRRPLFVYQK